MGAAGNKKNKPKHKHEASYMKEEKTENPFAKKKSK